jgi:hypothetical protein
MEGDFLYKLNVKYNNVLSIKKNIKSSDIT